MECGGHYIYYEKNLEMQNYMIASRKNHGFTPSEAIEDRATKNFRDVIKEKMKKNEERHSCSPDVCGKYFFDFSSVCHWGNDD